MHNTATILYKVHIKEGFTDSVEKRGDYLGPTI